MRFFSSHKPQFFFSFTTIFIDTIFVLLLFILNYAIDLDCDDPAVVGPYALEALVKLQVGRRFHCCYCLFGVGDLVRAVVISTLFTSRILFSNHSKDNIDCLFDAIHKK
jgi:hypothetical protein